MKLLRLNDKSHFGYLKAMGPVEFLSVSVFCPKQTLGYGAMLIWKRIIAMKCLIFSC